MDRFPFKPFSLVFYFFAFIVPHFPTKPSGARMWLDFPISRVYYCSHSRHLISLMFLGTFVAKMAATFVRKGFIYLFLFEEVYFTSSIQDLHFSEFHQEVVFVDPWKIWDESLIHSYPEIYQEHNWYWLASQVFILAPVLKVSIIVHFGSRLVA